MSQLIACKTQDGIVMGADSKAVDLDANGNLIEFKVDRLHPLSKYTAILNGGAAAGDGMCQALKNFTVEENLNYVDEIHQAALPFMASEYERYMRKQCEVQPIDPVHQVSFILGGYTPKDDRFQLYLLWTQRKLPLLDSDEIGTAFCIPRVIKMEHRLNQMAIQNAGLDDLMTTVRKGLEELAGINDEISQPFNFATIYKDGIQLL